jgi:hypothetical protein
MEKIMKNKRAWIKIMEAVLGIIIISGVVLVIYSQNAERQDLSEYIYGVQVKILKNIALDDKLRNDILTEPLNETPIREFIDNSIPGILDYEISICDVALPCMPALDLLPFDKDVYVEERLISSNLYLFNPKKIRFFVWEKTLG